MIKGDAESSGYKVVFFAGEIKLKDGSTARGAISGNTIYIRADHNNLSAEQIYLHEKFHGMLAKDSGLMQSAADAIVSEYSQSELDSLVGYYIEAYDGANLSYTEALEEILCDAYADINIFEGTNLAAELGGYGASKYAGKVRVTAFESKQSNQTDSGEVRLSRDNKWHTGMTNVEVQYIERMALHQLDTTDNYITDTAKWLYDTRKSQPYFAIYSTSEDATVLYASKGHRASVENEFLTEYIKELWRINNGNVRGSTTFSEIFQRVRDTVSKRNGNVARFMGSNSNRRNANLYSTTSGSKKRTAFRTVLNNISEIQFGDGKRDGTRFSRDFEGYIRANRKAVMSNERIDYLIDDSGSTSPTYAQKWITSINPTDFINLTTGKWQDRAKFDTLPGDYGSTVNEYDYIEGLKKEKRQTPYIALDESGQVRGHEGRHRMRALEKQGITKAEIVVEFCYDDGYINKNYNSNGKRLQTVDSITVENQMGTGQTVELNNVIPLNNDHKAEILSAYGEQTANEGDISYSRESATIEELKKENERLRKRLKDARRETKINPQAEFDEKSMNKFAKGLLNSYNSTLKYIIKEVKKCLNLYWVPQAAVKHTI